MDTRIRLSGHDARGRNGWFKAREASVGFMQTDGTVILSVVSHVPTYPGPIYMVLSREDAQALGAALVKVVKEKEEEGGERWTAL